MYFTSMSQLVCVGFFVYFTSFFGLGAKAGDSQGLFLVLHLSITLGSDARDQILQLCAGQVPCLLYYGSVSSSFFIIFSLYAQK